ncbi:component of the polarisome [Fusarium solani]
MSISERRNAPVPAVLLCGIEFSVSKGQLVDNSCYPRGSSNLASAPNSAGSNSYMSILGSPIAPRDNRGPLSPTSTTSSSITTDIHARADFDEIILNEHYLAFRAVLDTGDPKDKQQLSKSCNKLLRLTPAQLYELSTDVFDELMRRQSPASLNSPPAFLLPNNAFSSRRNQARQRLSAVGPPRFRDLVADWTENRTSTQGDLANPRSSTPFNGFAPRRQSRMREPPQAPSMIDPKWTDAYGFSASPSVPNFPRSPGTNGDYSPMPKQPDRDNANVPKRLSMVEEHDESESESDEFSLEQAASSRESTRSAGSGVTTKTNGELIEEYKSQLRQLNDKLRSMEDAMKNREEEISGVLDEERSRATAHNLEKQEWDDIRLDLENKLAEAQTLNDSMKQELQRVREDNNAETERLREEVASAQTEAREAQQVAAQHAAAQQALRGIEPVEPGSPLERVNGRLHHSLLEQHRAQRQAMEEVRKEIKEFLREMRALSQQSNSVYERQAEELGQTITRLEQEVFEWRIRYVRAKTQLRSTCASSVELGPEHDAIKLDRGKSFVDDHGLVKDIHVTEFQTAIDELLHKARTDDFESVIDAAKSVVVSMRRLTHDTKVPRSDDGDSARQRAKLRGEVSSATNSLITESMNYAAGAGLYPLSLLDAAASRVAGAIVDLLRLVKVQTTPAEDLEDPLG